MRRIPAAVLVVVLLTVAAFLPVRNAEFLNFDDPLYVTRNQTVLKGLHGPGILWALTTFEAANWHPLTWVSHMADVSLFGVRSGPHHLVNLGLHAAAAVLLLLLLQRMTGAVWPSFLTAALFAVHPLRVESVAWVSERKDVLSVLLGLVTLIAYLRYVRRPGTSRYLVVAAAFTLGLMAKPLLVTLPFVLLLLDWWPLGRFRTGGQSRTRAATAGPGRLLAEKAPLLALAAASSLLTYLAQRHGGALASSELFPLDARVANALVSYVGYLGKTLWPQHLIPFYVHPNATLTLARTAGACALLAAVTAVALRSRRHPWLATGWLWYLGTLVPVIGLVQVGRQGMADRYSYLPHIGLLLACSWEVCLLALRTARGRALLACCAAATLATLTGLTWKQSTYWHDTVSLFERTVSVDPRNDVAFNMLGANLLERNEAAAAIPLFRRALEVSPGNVEARYNLGLALARSGDPDGALEQFQVAVRLNPGDAESRYNLGRALLERGRAAEALQRLDEAIAIDPGQPEIGFSRGVALVRLNRLGEAAEAFRGAIGLDAQYAEAHYRLGMTLDALGRFDEAATHYRSALKARPGYPEAHNNLGVTLAEQGRLEEARYHFEEAVRLKPAYAEARANLENLLRSTRP